VLVARHLNPRPGSTFLMALIAASAKMLSFSTVKVGPFVGIIMEGVLLEIILSMLGTRRLAFLFSALFIGLYPILQSIVTKTILFGADFVPVILELVEGFSARMGHDAGWWILGLYIGLHLIISGTFAVLTWLVLYRRHEPPPEPAA